MVLPSQSSCSSLLTSPRRQDVFVLLDLLGTARPSVYNYPYCAAAEFRQLAGVERRLAKSDLLGGVPRVFRVRKTWSAPVRIEDDHLPFMSRGGGSLPLAYPASSVCLLLAGM